MESTLNILIFIIFLICTVFPLFHMGNALVIMLKKPYYLKRVKPLKEKSLSILVPCFNEQAIIETALFGMKNLNYINYEYILINDGSTDDTFEVMSGLLDLERMNWKHTSGLDYMPVRGVYKSKRYKNVFVIDKENGGKADALNAGIEFSSNELVVTLDADSILDEQALTLINKAFQDHNVVAAAGMVHVLQGRKVNKGILTPTLNLNAIVRFQILEYFRGFYIYKASLARLNALAIISGAFGIFKRDVLIEIGGYRSTVGEDIDITLKVQNYINERIGLKIMFIPEAKCFTEVPENLKDLFKQRIRWQKAFTDCLLEYRKSFMRTLVTRPLSFFFILESFFTGIFCGYLMILLMVTTLILNPSTAGQYFIVYLFAAFTLNTAYNLLSIYIANGYEQKFHFRDWPSLIYTLLQDLFIFRFLTLFFVLYGTIQYFFNKEGWNKVARTGRQYDIEKAG